jgi:hypothetical protein
MSMGIPMSIKLFEALSGLIPFYSVSLHSMKTFHEQFPTIRDYAVGEVRNASPSLGGKPLILDHVKELPYPNRITRGWFDEALLAACCEGLVTPQVAAWIRNGEIKGVSIELRWDIPGGSVAFVDGFQARGFEFTGLSLLHQLEAGDKNAFIRLAEAIYTPRPHEPAQPEEPKEPTEPHLEPVETKRAPTFSEKVKKHAGI